MYLNVPFRILEVLIVQSYIEIRYASMRHTYILHYEVLKYLFVYLEGNILEMHFVLQILREGSW